MSTKQLRAVALVMAFGLVVLGCESPMFRYGPAHTGYNPTETSASAISTTNVAGLSTKFTGTTGAAVRSSAAVVAGVAYVGSQDGKLNAFKTSGVASCPGTPKNCDPLWTATTGTAPANEFAPAVVNGIVYISAGATLFAFDAAGITNCSGAPKTCAPLWTFSPELETLLGTPVVANGVVYVGGGSRHLYAVDATGAHCSGTPTACAALWTGIGVSSFFFSPPAVANGIVYTGAGSGVLTAFDAAGISNCSGTPTECAPLWSANLGNILPSSPAVADGVVYIISGPMASGNTAALYAFDAAGITNCAGTPTICDPLWHADLPASASSPAVANGVVYVSAGDGTLRAFDAGGVGGCSGVPTTCGALWTGAIPGGSPASSPTVANGVVFVSASAFDAAGLMNCSGTPTSCTPLWSATVVGAGESSPTVASGILYICSTDGKLHAFSR